MKVIPSYTIVTPVRVEVACIGRTLEAVARQTVLPLQWIIVDDGSTDGTDAVLDHFAADHSWVIVLHRSNRGFRANGGGVMDAFYAGFALVERAQWDYLVKLDGDLSFAPDYFEQCLEKFVEEPELGIGGGVRCARTSMVRFTWNRLVILPFMFAAPRRYIGVRVGTRLPR